jgi:uncharacterized protein YxjI
MSELDGSLYFVKEHVGMFKAANNYDICDPQSSEVILECREPNLGMFTKILRFTNYKHFTPFSFTISNKRGACLVKVQKGWTFLGATVSVFNERGKLVGFIKRKLFSLKPKMTILNAKNEQVGDLVGSFIGWNFTFTHRGDEKAKVTKEWAGMAKELFTTADNYVLSINETTEAGSQIRPMIFASVLCIDMLFKN